MQQYLRAVNKHFTSIEVINKAEKNKVLDRVLEIEVPVEIYEELRKIKEV